MHGSSNNVCIFRLFVSSFSCVDCFQCQFLVLPFLPRSTPSCVYIPRWIYSSTLAYIVDANVGRSSSAVAASSVFRGTAGFVMTEVAVPLQVRGVYFMEHATVLLRLNTYVQDAIGDGERSSQCYSLSFSTDYICTGWMYTLWSGLMVIAGLLVFAVTFKGESWRHSAELREEHAKRTVQ